MEKLKQRKIINYLLLTILIFILASCTNPTNYTKNNLTSFLTINDRIYYINTYDNGYLYQFDNNQAKLVLPKKIQTFFYHDNYLYIMIPDEHNTAELFKTDLNGRNMTTLNQNIIPIAEENGFIYYVMDKMLYQSSKLFQTDQSIADLSDFNSIHKNMFLFDHDTLYVTTNNSIEKIQISTQERSTLVQGELSNLIMYNQDIYYLKYDRNQNAKLLYTMSSKTAAETQVSSHPMVSYWILHNQIYFSMDYSSEQTCKLNQDDSADTFVSLPINHMDYDNGWIYFCANSPHRYLYRIKEDGSDLQLLHTTNITNFSIIDDWIYYYNYGSSTSEPFRIKLDGSIIQTLGYS